MRVGAVVLRAAQQKTGAATWDGAARNRGQVRGMSVFVVVCQSLCRLTHTQSKGRGGHHKVARWVMECVRWQRRRRNVADGVLDEEKVMSVCSQHK